MVTATDEEWVELASRDDHLVAELLLCLCRAAPPSCKSAPAPALPLDWSVRQPRSGGPKKKEDTKRRRKKKKQHQEEGVEPMRASPTTPLSWSGATSTSGGADGAEESSRSVRPPYNARSKVSIFTATANSTIPKTKRPKRKKTLAELKEEESLLLKERRNLGHELAALRLTVEHERAKNELFMRKKLDLQLRHIKAIAARDIKADCEPLEPFPKGQDNISVAAQQNPPTDDASAASQVERWEMMLELPDLNVPLDEQCGP